MNSHRYVLHRRVVVNLLSGTAISGVITKSSGPLLILRDAQVMQPDSQPSDVDGEIVVDKSNVDFIQAL